MRLVKNVARLESAAVQAARGQAVPRPIGIVWTQHEVKVDADLLGDDEYVALDVVVESAAEPREDVALQLAASAAERLAAGVRDPLPAPECWRIRERVTRDRNDLGTVRDAAGELLGWIVRLDGSLITWEPIAAAGLGAA